MITLRILVAALVAAAGLAGGSTLPGAQAAPEPGDVESVAQVASLIYAKTKSSVCFSDHFLREARKVTTVSTSGRLHPVRMEAPELFNHPLAIMTGEGTFALTEAERANLAEFLKRGGFLLASAGCSSADWDRSFRVELGRVLPGRELAPLPMTHPVFHTAKDIAQIELKHGTPRPLAGVEIDGRLAVIYSSDGLNDTAHVSGCCCCGGNEVRNAIDINVNILLYAMTR